MTLITSRLTPQFRYDTERQRFIATNGRYVARETVIAANELIVKQSQDDMREVSEQFQRGEIAHAEWDAAMRLNIRRGTVAAHVVGAGGFDNMTPTKWGRAGAQVKEEYEFLNGMGERVQSGYYGDDLSRNGFMAHATSYGLAPRTMYQYAQAMNAMEELGHDEIANELDASRERACQGAGSCRDVTDLGYVSPDDPRWLWPGDRLCLNHCRCRVVSRSKYGDQFSGAEAGRLPIAPDGESLTRPGGKPIGKALRNQAKGERKQRIDATLNLIDTVNGDGDLPSLPIQVEVTKGFDGFLQTEDGVPVRILVSRKAEHVEMTTVHEVGHFLDLMGAGKPYRWSSAEDELWGEWRDAVDASQATAKLKEILSDGYEKIEVGGTENTTVIKRDHLEYLLRRREQFARSYAQYVTNKSRSPRLREQLEQRRSGSRVLSAKQWADEDFVPIEAAMDRLFKKLGWIL